MTRLAPSTPPEKHQESSGPGRRNRFSHSRVGKGFACWRVKGSHKGVQDGLGVGSSGCGYSEPFRS